ncbi:MAG: hypothetical protein WKG07_22190 [Hymenobacter sp.]
MVLGGMPRCRAAGAARPRLLPTPRRPIEVLTTATAHDPARTRAAYAAGAGRAGLPPGTAATRGGRNPPRRRPRHAGRGCAPPPCCCSRAATEGL